MSEPAVSSDIRLHRLPLLLPMLLLLSPAAAAPASATAPPPCFIHPAPFTPLRVPRSSSPRTAVHAASSSAAGALESPEAVFQRWFRGQFDNAAQVSEERTQGMGPGEEGGHEQIHCVLEPLPALRPGSLGGGQRFLGATYYFDDRPEAVFRCRVYSFHPPPQPLEEDGDQQAAAAGPSSAALPNPPFAEMRLHRFTPAFEDGLRKGGYDLQALLTAEDVDEGGGGGALEELDGCSIMWAVGEDGRARGGELSFRGVMRHGFCEVGSQREAGVRLRIEDDLLLTEGQLSVNDRGFDCATGRLVYGNHRNVPYRMTRRRW